MPLNEFEIIKNCFTRQSRHSTVVCGIGDDCAIVSPSEGKQLVMSMDSLVAGTHFPNDAAPYDIATRALCTSLSDLAAMGAKPLWFTLGLTIPEVNDTWLSAFSDGLFTIARRYDVDLIGGDTTRGPLTVTIQVHGEVDSGAALTRSAAQVGDSVFVTGPLGDGAAALSLIQGGRFSDPLQKEYLWQRFYQPLPQIETGLHLSRVANAAIDISDGLLADASHIAVASQIVLKLDLDALPMSAALIGNEQYDRDQCLEWALSGGDDYQLLFTVSQNRIFDVTQLCQSDKLNAIEIGYVAAIESKPGVECLREGQKCDVADMTNHKGYQHFVS